MENNELIEYEAKVSHILSLITKAGISPEEETELVNFIEDYWHKYDIFTNEEIVPENVWKSVGKGKIVIVEAYKLTTPGARIITDEFTKRIEDDTRNNQNKGAKLVRINPNGNTLPNNENDQNLDIAGFTNVLAIVTITLVLGLVLAAFIIGSK